MNETKCLPSSCTEPAEQESLTNIIILCNECHNKRMECMILEHQKRDMKISWRWGRGDKVAEEQMLKWSLELTLLMTVVKAGILRLYANLVLLGAGDVQGVSQTTVQRRKKRSRSMQRGLAFSLLLMHPRVHRYSISTVFPSEMGYKVKPLIMMRTQRAFESLPSVLTSLLSSSWMGPALCRYFYLEVFSSPHLLTSH